MRVVGMVRAAALNDSNRRNILLLTYFLMGLIYCFSLVLITDLIRKRYVVLARVLNGRIVDIARILVWTSSLFLTIQIVFIDASETFTSLPFPFAAQVLHVLHTGACVKALVAEQWDGQLVGNSLHFDILLLLGD